MGTGIPPNIKTSRSIAIMPTIIRGIRKRKIARAIIAIRAMTSRDIVDPLKGRTSITTSNINFEARKIEIMS